MLCGFNETSDEGTFCVLKLTPGIEAFCMVDEASDDCVEGAEEFSCGRLVVVGLAIDSLPAFSHTSDCDVNEVLLLTSCVALLRSTTGLGMDVLHGLVCGLGTDVLGGAFAMDVLCGLTCCFGIDVCSFECGFPIQVL